MSTGKKPATPAPTTPPPSATTPPPKPAQQPTAPAQPTMKPLISRRAFLRVAIGASAILAAGSLATSGEIFSPVPQPRLPNDYTITNALGLEANYQQAVASLAAAVSAGTVPSGTPLNPLDPANPFAQFFYWPYDVKVSPYYRNVIVRLPDETLDPSVRGSTPRIEHYAAWNTTCVHLRCLVNPGYASGQYRLQCPCHGSQYRLTDAVPVAGPAYDLGLLPLPRIRLKLDSNNNILADSFDGDPGVGRTD